MRKSGFNIGLRGVPALLFFCGFFIDASCAELSVEPVSAHESIVELAIRFTSQGSSVAALEFEINCSPSVRIIAVPDAAVAAAGKALYVVPVGRRRGMPVQRLRFLIVGLNQSALVDGTIVSLTVRPGTSHARLGGLAFSNISASNPDGQPVSLIGREWPDANSLQWQ